VAIFILPDAQEDLLSLQEYMLDKWSASDWLKAEDEIFEKLALVYVVAGHRQDHPTLLMKRLLRI
jgi:toxin ParE1/3/4